MDRSALLSKDPLVAAANRTVAEWQKKAKEDERRKKQQKLRARERGEETDSDDDDEDDEVVADTKWDDLASEDALIGTYLSVQGPFLFHAGESTSTGPAETGQTVGLPKEIAGASGSAAAPKVPAQGVAPPPHLKSYQGWADLSPLPRCRWRGQLCCRALGRKGGGSLCLGARGGLKMVPLR